MIPRQYCLIVSAGTMLSCWNYPQSKREKDQSTEMSMESKSCHALIVPYVHSELQKCEIVLSQPSEMLLLHQPLETNLHTIRLNRSKYTIQRFSEVTLLCNHYHSVAIKCSPMLRGPQPHVQTALSPTTHHSSSGCCLHLPSLNVVYKWNHKPNLCLYLFSFRYI